MKDGLKLVKRLISDFIPYEADVFFARVNRAVSLCKGDRDIPKYGYESYFIAELQWEIAYLIAGEASRHGDFKIKHYLMRLRRKSVNTISNATELYYEWTFVPETGQWE